MTFLPSESIVFGQEVATVRTIDIAGHRAIDVPAFAGAAFQKLPWLQRVLLENVLRKAGPESLGAAAAIVASVTRSGERADIPFYPTRVFMHDTTFGPALVDIAAMRSALSSAGREPACLNPVVPVDVSVDHSIAVDHFGVRGAFALNLDADYRRNAERYRFMKWGARALTGVRIHPPGAGIMHTINLERVASVVSTGIHDGVSWIYPDTLIGTDSHTPMVNGLGVLGWGVGGLEAESVLFGMPVMLLAPDVVGVRLTGRLSTGAFATDLALLITERLRRLSLSGRFVEFFGPGVSTLSAGERCVIANMAPEFGASSGFFPIDDETIRYLASTGRPAAHCALVANYAKRQNLWFDPEAQPSYSEVVDIDIADATMSIAGPRRPQDRMSPSAVPTVLRTLVRSRSADARVSGLPDGAVAIAAVTSCTNTSDPRMLIAAGLVARNARRLKCVPPSWVKTSCAPGSPTAERYLARAGLLDDLDAIGFSIVGYGCTTCIGNSGPLVPEMDRAIREHGVTAVAVLSGNRNFPGRIHPDIDAAFLCSPPLVVAYALAGDVARDITTDPIGRSNSGAPVYLRDVWPDPRELDLATQAVETSDIAMAYDAAQNTPRWNGVDAPATPLFPWDPESTYLREPPFASARVGTTLGNYVAHPLLVLGDDITTDDISPAGQIAPTSDAGRHLIEHGEDPADLNVFGARRGNWEVMLRGLFTSRGVRNLLDQRLEAGQTVHAPSGMRLSVWRAANRYIEDGERLVIVAGDRYGTGSSRDWAAKGLRLLGVSAVLASSFERIHRSNLIGMGILPLVLPERAHPMSLSLAPGDRIAIDADSGVIGRHSQVQVRILRSEGRVEALETVAAIETALEAELLRTGGMIPLILQRKIASK